MNVAPLVAQIISILDLRRLLFPDRSAVIVRGTPDELAIVEALVANFAESH